MASTSRITIAPKGKKKKSKNSRKKGPIIISQDVPLSSASSESEAPQESYLDYRYRCTPRTGNITQVTLQRGEYIPQGSLTPVPDKRVHVVDGSEVPDFDFNQVINHYFRVGNTVGF